MGAHHPKTRKSKMIEKIFDVVQLILIVIIAVLLAHMTP
jgi:hypothetical protein